MTVTEVFNGTDIDYVRILMGQAGRLHQVIESDEPTIAVTTDKMYTEFKNVSDVIGVWDNLEHSGTNHIDGGEYYGTSGELTMSGTTLTPGGEYYISYVHQDGLTDRQIQQAIDDAKSFLRLQLFEPLEDSAFEDVVTQKGLIMRTAMLNKSSVNGIAILNMGNIIQSGFNYALGELRIETKLWGEGMSTEGLLMVLQRKIDELIDYLKLYYTGDILYVSDRSYMTPSYDKQRWKTMMGAGYHGQWISDGVVMSLQYRIVDPR